MCAAIPTFASAGEGARPAQLKPGTFGGQTPWDSMRASFRFVPAE
jgi:hypothetical protein